MSKLFKQPIKKKKSNKVDFFDITRYFGFLCLGVTFFMWGFGAYEDRWTARALLAIAILFNFIYDRFIFKKVRDMEKRN